MSSCATTRVKSVKIEPLERRTLFAAPTAFVSRGPGGGGAFFGPSFSPYNANEMYVASDMSGVYHSTNLGASWQIEDFRQLQGGRTSSVQFTSDPNILYTLDTTGDDGAPSRSADAGVTWHRVSGSPGGIVGMAADPTSTTRLLAWSYDTLYLSTNGGTSFTTSFAYTTQADEATGLYVAGAFFDGSNVYVGTNAGLLVSTNGGTSFTVSTATGIPSGKEMFGFAGTKSGTTTRLYCSLLNSADVFSGMDIESAGVASFSGIYSLDAGQSAWVSRSATIPSGDAPYFVSVPRGDINTIYAAGASMGGNPIVIKSSNSGSNWTSVLTTANNQNIATGWQGAGGDRDWSFGELALDFSVDPVDANKLAFTDFGFIHLSTDGGTTWRQAYLNPADQNSVNTSITKHKPYHGVGLEDTSALWMTWTSASNVFAGYTDINGVRSVDDGVSWSFPTVNPRQNTIYQVSTAGTGTLYAASSSIHDLYQSTYLTDARIETSSATGGVLYSTDAGVTWNMLHDFGMPVIYTAIDPANPNRMYASVVNHSTGGIYVTNNLDLGTNSTWTLLPAPPRTQGHPYDIRILNDGSLVVSYSGRRDSTGFTASSGVFLSNDGGQTWADRTDTVLTGMEYYTKEITIDPSDPNQNIWYAAVRSGFGGHGNDMGGLYKTTDRGQHWTRIFSTDSCESLTIVPATGEMYLATLDQGLWYSTGGASPSFSQLTSYPFRQPERVFLNPYNPGEIWVTSFGYGVAAQVDVTPPRVSSAVLQYAGATKSLDFTFSEDVSPMDLTAITVTNLATSATVTPSTVSFNNTTLTASFGFASGIPTGRYRATLSASKIKDKTQNAMSASSTFDFIFVNAGTTLALPAGGQTFATQQVAIGSGGKFDLADNKLAINYSGTSPLGSWNGSAYDGITGLIATGRNGGSWNGNGISSSAITSSQQAIGVAEASEVLNISGTQTAVWNNQTVDATTLLLRYSYTGDADLNGKIDGDDYFRIDAGFSAHATGYASGDFNYDGRVNADDYFVIDANYSHALTPLSVIFIPPVQMTPVLHRNLVDRIDPASEADDLAL